MVGCNTYLTPPGAQGFAPHYDDIEVSYRTTSQCGNVYLLWRLFLVAAADGRFEHVIGVYPTTRRREALARL